MEKITKREKQTVHFLKWINLHSGWWYLICTPNTKHMNMETMKSLIEQLEKEQFYEIIFVLLMVHRHENFVENMFNYLLLDILTENWKGNSINGKQIIKDVLHLLT